MFYKGCQAALLCCQAEKGDLIGRRAQNDSRWICFSLLSWHRQTVSPFCGFAYLKPFPLKVYDIYIDQYLGVALPKVVGHNSCPFKGWGVVSTWSPGSNHCQGQKAGGGGSIVKLEGTSDCDFLLFWCLGVLQRDSQGSPHTPDVGTDSCK